MHEPKFSYNDIINEFCRRIQTTCDNLIEELRTFEDQDLKDEKVLVKLTLLEEKIKRASLKYALTSPDLVKDNPIAINICQDKSKYIVDEMNKSVKEWFHQYHQDSTENI